jgi:hypothetical protein
VRPSDGKRGKNLFSILQFPAKKIMKEIWNSQKRDFPGGKRRSGETGKSTFHHMMRGGV